MTDIVQSMRAPQAVAHPAAPEVEGLSEAAFLDVVRRLEKEMRQAADRLEFEVAAALRDEIRELKKDYGVSTRQRGERA